MATEYAGYIPADSFVDYEALSGKLAEKIYGIGKSREEQKTALDQAAKDAEKLVNDPSIVGTNETFANVILGGADSARKNIWEWNRQLKNGDITPKQYKENINTLQDNWGMLAESAKTFDDRYKEIMRRQQDGEASDLELEFGRRFGQMAEIKNSKIEIGKDGRVYMTKTDPNTGKIVGDFMDVRTMNRPENILVNKVNVDGNVAAVTEGWDPWTIWKDMGRGSEVTIEDIRQNPEFGYMKASVAESIAPDSNPRAQVSVLTDNGVISSPNYYINDSEYAQMKQEAIDRIKSTKRTAGQPETLTKEEMDRIDNSMIKLEKDPSSGIMNPVLTEEQKRLAKERVMKSVEIELERKVTGSPKQQWSSTSGGGGGGTDQVDDTLYEKMANAWKNGDMTALNSLLKNKRYKVEQVEDKGMRLVQVNVDDLTGQETIVEVVPPTRDLSRLNPYFFGTGAAATKKAEQQVQEYRRKNNGGTTTTTTNKAPR